MGFDRVIDRIQKSSLSPEAKAAAIRVIEHIRAVVNAMRGFVVGMIATIREHQDAVRILAIALLVAILAKAIPVIGDLLAALAILCGLVGALVVEIRKALTGLLNLDIVEEPGRTR